MAQLKQMPPINVSEADLLRFGRRWEEKGGRLSRTPPESSSQLVALFDSAVGHSLSVMLGDIDIIKPSLNNLLPSQPDCVEVGTVKIVGGVRPQNFDVGYRPDGPRFVFDSKSLNDSLSLGKNFLNMVNDLATEATTVHTRYPYAIVAFMFIVPKPCFDERQRLSIKAIQILDRLSRRDEINDPEHLAEAIAVVVWDPRTGSIINDQPSTDSNLRIENFSRAVEKIYRSRYKGLPPHESVGS